MSQPSPTPRTDEAAFDYSPEPSSSDWFHGPDSGPDEVVHADFARELERESDRLREALTELRRWVADGECSDDAGIWPGYATTAYKAAVMKADAALSNDCHAACLEENQ